MFFWLQLVVVAAVVFVVTAVALGAGGSLPEAYPDRPDVVLPADRPMTPRDVEELRFPVVFRGYRMDDVDEALYRLMTEIAVRDVRIAQLEARATVQAADAQDRPAPDGLEQRMPDAGG